MKEIVSSELIQETLDMYSISHGDIVLHANHNNFTFSDGSKVFVKASRPGFLTNPLETELNLALEYGERYMLIPLWKNLIRVQDFAITLWRYENLQSFTHFSLTTQNAEDLALELMSLHSLPLPTNTNIKPMVDFDRLRKALKTRIDFGYNFGLSTEDAKFLEQLGDKFLSKPLPTKNLVLNHGDAHVGNASYREKIGHAGWFDYESARITSREFDIATMRTNVLLLGKNPEAWMAASKVFEERTVEEENVRLFTIARLISMTSYLLLHPDHYPVMYQRLEVMKSLLKSGKIPLTFP